MTSPPTTASTDQSRSEPPDRRKRSTARVLGRWLRLLAGVTLAFAAAEATARVAEPHVDPPLEWASEEMAAKIDLLGERHARGDVGGVVIAGSSQAATLDARLLVEAGVAPTAFNSAVPGAVAVVQERWLLEEVVPRTQPDLVILGVGPLDFVAEPNDLPETYARARATRAGFVGDVERYLAERSALVRLRPRVRGARAIDELASATKSGDATTYLALDGTRVGRFEHEVAADAARDGRHRADASEHGLEALRTIASSLQAEGIEVLFVYLPIAPLDPEAPGRSRENVAMLEVVGDELGIPVIDLTERYDTLEDFRDPAHLTAEAALDATALIARAVGGTPDLLPGEDTRLVWDARSERSMLRSISSPHAGWLDLELRELPGRPDSINLVIEVATSNIVDRTMVTLTESHRNVQQLRTVQGTPVARHAPRAYLVGELTLRIELPLVATSSDGARVRIELTEPHVETIELTAQGVLAPNGVATSVPLAGLVRE